MKTPTRFDILSAPKRYGYGECTRCNGYGSSLREDCATCSVCGGLGLVKVQTIAADMQAAGAGARVEILREGGEA